MREVIIKKDVLKIKNLKRFKLKSPKFKIEFLKYMSKRIEIELNGFDKK